MIAEAEASLRSVRTAEHQLALDLRYVGQEFSLSVPVAMAQIEAGDAGAIRAAFDALHDQRYAHHSAEEPVEVVNLRLAAVGKRARLRFPPLPETGKPVAARTQRVFLHDTAQAVDCPVYERETLGAGAEIAGPAVIQETATTTLLWPGDACRVAPTGEMIISVGNA
jgi:N-methylhydantoinase A